MKINITSIVGIAAVLTLAIATVAFARGGWGDGSHMGRYGGHMMGPGYGGGHMMDYDCNYGYHMRGHGAWRNLSEKRDRFYTEVLANHILLFGSSVVIG